MIDPANLETVMPKITSRCRRQVAAAFTRWQNAELTTTELRDVLVAVIVGANAAGRVAAEVLAAVLLRRTGIDPGATPMVQHATDDSDRLSAAVGTVLAALDTDSNVAGRLDRLAASEPPQAAQDHLVAAYRSHGVNGWTRGLESDACDLCRDWAGDGDVFPASVTPLHHPGCACTPIPTTEKG